MILDLDAKTRLEIASMVYARWSTAYDAMKQAKAATWENTGKFCPKNEWHLYHADMIKNAQAELDLAIKLKDDICKFSPLIAGE